MIDPVTQEAVSAALDAANFRHQLIDDRLLVYAVGVALAVLQEQYCLGRLREVEHVEAYVDEHNVLRVETREAGQLLWVS